MEQKTRTTTLEEYAFKKEKRKTSIKRRGSVAFFLGPYFICFVLFFAFPFIYGLIISLCSFDGTSFTPSGFVGLDNYVKLFTSRVLIKDFWSSVWYTFRFAIIIVPLCILIPLGLALLTSVKPKGYKFFRACIYIPGIFPLTATGLILLRMFSFQNGFINSFLNISVDWFGSVNTAWLMVGLFCIWGGIGGNYIILSAGLENVDKTLVEASEIDGSNMLQRFRYIILPAIKPQLILCLFTTLIGYMNLYGQNFILLSNTPDQDAIKTAIYRIQDLLLGNSRSYGIAASMAVSLGFIIAVFSGIQMYATKERRRVNKYACAYKEWEKSH